MKRVALVLVVAVVVLGTALGLRLRQQAHAIEGPSRGSGEIEGTTVDVASRLSARIERLAVRKGAAVKRGELLVQLDCAEARATVAEAEARLAAATAQAQAAQVSIGAARSSQAAAAAAKAIAEAQAASLAAQRDATLRQATRLDQLASDVAAASRDQTRATAEQLRHQVEAMEAQASASLEQTRVASASWRASTAQAQAAQSSARAVEAALVRARLLAAECEVRAPRDGMIAELPHEAGELIAPGTVLARLVDLTEVRATFYLPNAELAAVRTGATAQVVADAYPNEVFEGKVATVALEAEFTPRNIQTRTDRDRLVYPVEVTIQNRDRKLRAGMPVEVSLPGTERR